MGKKSSKSNLKKLFCEQLIRAEGRKLEGELDHDWIELAKDLIEIRDTKSYTTVEYGPGLCYKKFEDFLSSYGWSLDIPMTPDSLKMLSDIISVVETAEKGCQDLTRAMMCYANQETWKKFLTIKPACWNDLIAKLSLREYKHGDNINECIREEIDAFLKSNPSAKVGYRKAPSPCDAIWGLSKNITECDIIKFRDKLKTAKDEGADTLEVWDRFCAIAAMADAAEDIFEFDSCRAKPEEDEEAEEKEEDHPVEVVTHSKFLYGLVCSLMIFGVYGICNIIYIIISLIIKCFK